MKAAEQKNSSTEKTFLLQEPLDNSYCIVEPHKMNMFPYAFLGILRCKFELGKETIVTEGVGMIIGEDLVLTSADNLYYNNSDDKFLYPSSIDFIPGINGNIQVFKEIHCRHFIFNEKFREGMKKSDGGKNQSRDYFALYDYAIVFLPWNVGGEIISLFGMANENPQRFGYNDQTLKIYNFFEEHVNLLDKLECIHKKGFSDSKISMVSFTKYSSDKNYKYKSSFANINSKFYLSKQRAFKFTEVKKTLNGICTGIGNEEKKLTDTYISTRRTTENSFFTSESPGIDALLHRNSFFICNNDQVYSWQSSENVNMGNYFLFHKEEEKNAESYMVGDSNFYSEEDQSVLCEVKGRLLKFNDEAKGKEMLKYLITTYKGQSGSPIFLRIKSKYISSNKPSNACDDSHELVLLGIHTVPKLGKSGDKKDNNLTDSMRYYSRGILLTSKLLDNLKKMILQKKSDIGYILTPQITPEYNYDYTVVQIYAYDEFILQGLFHKMSIAGNLFGIAEKIFNIPEIFLLFRAGEHLYKSEDDESKWKTISELSSAMCHHPEENILAPSVTIYFEIDVTSYGESLGKKIVEKIKVKDPKIEERLFKKDVVSTNKVVQTILREIQPIYSKSMFLYGLLFKSIKDAVFQDVV